MSAPRPAHPQILRMHIFTILKSTLTGHSRVHAEGYICKTKGGRILTRCCPSHSLWRSPSQRQAAGQWAKDMPLPPLTKVDIPDTVRSWECRGIFCNLGEGGLGQARQKP